MESWSLKKRMDTLTLGMLSVIVVVSLLGAITTWRMSIALSDVFQSSSQTRQFADVEAELLNARLNALLYRIDGTDERAEEVNASIEEILKVEEGLENTAVPGSQEELMLRTLKSDLLAYKDKFASLQRLQTLSVSLVDVAAYAGMEAQEGLLDLLADDTMMAQGEGVELAGLAQQEFLLSRIALERYLRTNSEQNFSASSDALDRSTDHLNALLTLKNFSLPGVKIEAILANFAEFRQLGIDAYNAIAMRDDARDALLESGNKIQSDVFELLQLISEQQKTTAESAKLSANSAIILLFVISTVVLVAAATFAKRLSSRISHAISDAIEDMNALADGNLDVEIRGSDDENELGDMARALMVFRRNAIEARDLAAATAENERRAVEEEKNREVNRLEAQHQHEKDTQAARQKVLETLSEEIGAVVTTAAGGDFTARISGTFNDVELQKMADAVNTLVESVEVGVTATAISVNDIAAGDLTSQMTGTFQGQFASLQENVNATILTLARIVREISGVVGTVSNQSDMITEAAEGLATQAEIQAASIEETTEAMREVAQSAQSNADMATAARATAETATEQADEASEIAVMTKNAMAEIHDASQQIGEIVELIDAIAFQTNILALNASVEAARAGHAGKGFAVVASEVRALAQRTGDASQNIKTLIDQCAEKVTSGVDLVDQTSRSIAEIIEFVRTMAEALHDMTATSHDQAHSVNDICTALAQLDTITQRNAQVADRGRSNARLLRDDSRKMADLITVFRISERDRPEVSGKDLDAPYEDNAIADRHAPSDAA
ncbi:MAG: methyl-accepting chemotaxis protein [Pseudomonadota bacterium]